MKCIWSNEICRGKVFERNLRNKRPFCELHADMLDAADWVRVTAKIEERLLHQR